MSVVRVYLNIDGLSVSKVIGHYNIEIPVPNSTPFKIAMCDDNGVPFIHTSPACPSFHPSLRSRVIKATLREEILLTDAKNAGLTFPSRVRSLSGKATAEITRTTDTRNGNPVILNITATSLPALLAMRRKLLFDKALVV